MNYLIFSFLTCWLRKLQEPFSGNILCFLDAIPTIKRCVLCLFQLPNLVTHLSSKHSTYTKTLIFFSVCFKCFIFKSTFPRYIFNFFFGCKRGYIWLPHHFGGNKENLLGLLQAKKQKSDKKTEAKVAWTLRGKGSNISSHLCKRRKLLFTFLLSKNPIPQSRNWKSSHKNR